MNEATTTLTRAALLLIDRYFNILKAGIYKRVD